jgi:hypothetical protein
MTKIECKRCGATATVRRTAPNKLRVHYDGEMFWQCQKIKERLAAEGTCNASAIDECPNMSEAIRTQA